MLASSLVFSNEEERLEILYQKIERLEAEIRELRNLLEENSILVDRSVELQQQRYLDLDARLLELSKITSVEDSESEDSAISSTSDEERELFRNALVLFEESRYAEALELFTEIIIAFPFGDYAAEAYFWSGELFLAQLKYEDAKLSFLSVVDQFPDHERISDSLYKLGEIERVQGNATEALNYYSKVITNFAESGAAQLAKKSEEIVKEQSNLVD